MSRFLTGYGPRHSGILLLILVQIALLIVVAMASSTDRDVEFKFEKLTTENYHTWKFNMKMFLIGKDLWDVVQGTETIGENATVEERRKFQKRQNLALASVCLSISSSLQIYVRAAETGKDAWESLAKHFQQKTLSKKIQLRRQLYSMKLDKGADMVNHINSMKTLSEHLEAIGDPIAEHDLVIILISSLHEDYNFLITALETIEEDKLTWDYVRDRLIHEAEKTSKSQMKNDALLTSSRDGRKSKKDFRCHYCNEKNHYARDCKKREADEKASLAIDEEEEGEEPIPEVALKSDRIVNAEGEWWIDSGASQHMTFIKKGMENFEAFKQPLNIQLADNSQVKSFGKGDVRVPIMNGNERVNLLLKDVLFIPKLKNKLFSLPAAIEKGANVEFSGQSCHLKVKDRKLTIGHKHGRLFKLNVVTKGKPTERKPDRIATFARVCKPLKFKSRSKPRMKSNPVGGLNHIDQVGGSKCMNDNIELKLKHKRKPPDWLICER